MSEFAIQKGDVERLLASVTVVAGSLAFGGVLVISEVVIVEHPVLVGAVPLSIVAMVGILSVGYIHYIW